jgi:hypothetical protein
MVCWEKPTISIQITAGCMAAFANRFPALEQVLKAQAGIVGVGKVGNTDGRPAGDEVRNLWPWLWRGLTGT